MCRVLPALLFPLLLVGCGRAPSPAAPVHAPESQRPARTVADIAGAWVSVEDLDWHMTIDASGTIDVWFDRDKGGRCEQKGTITPGPVASQFRLLYTVGGCMAKVVNVPIDATISSLTASHLTIVVGGQPREYERARNGSDDDRDKPSGL